MCFGSPSSAGDDLPASECESKTSQNSDPAEDAGKLDYIRGLSLSLWMWVSMIGQKVVHYLPLINNGAKNLYRQFLWQQRVIYSK